MWEKTPAFFAPREIMEKTAQFVTSPQSCGEKVSRMQMTPLKEKQTSKLWREGVENADDTAKREAKKLFARKRYYSPIIVRGEESKGVRVWAYGKMAYETLLSYVLDPDYGDITNPETGTDIVLNYSVPGTPGSFPKTTLKPRRRPSVLCDEDVADCDELLDSVPEIETIFQRHSTSEVQSLLDEYLSSDESSESLSSETEQYNRKRTVDDALQSFMNNDTAMVG